MKTNRTRSRWFKSNAVASVKTENLNREAGTAKDVVLCEVGEASGHGVHLEQEFIDDTAKYAQANHETNGLKSRFGHPDASSTTMGNQLGYYKNFRVRNNQVIADYQLLQAAKISKKGDMWNWFFDLAEEKPDFIMSSIVFAPAGEYQYDDDGNRHWVWISKIGEDAGYKYSEDYEYDRKKPVYVKMGHLYFADMVENGAATNSLFSAEVNDHMVVSKADLFFDQHPKVLDLLQKNPSILFKYARKKGIKMETSPWFVLLKKMFSGSTEDDETLIEANEQLTIQYQQLSEELDTALARVKVLEADKKQLKAEAIGLKADIKRLEGLPLGDDPKKFKKDPPLPKEKVKRKLSIEEKAKKYAARHKKQTEE